MYKREKKVRACIDCGCEIWTTQFRKPIKETRCKSCAFKGDRHPNWQGGIAGKKKIMRICVDCGCEIFSIQFHKPVAATRCMSCARKGPRHHNWKGGRRMSNGYIEIWRPSHPRATKAGYVKRSCLVWEDTNERYVQPGEIIHHIDGSRDNDVIENLRLMTDSEHKSLHILGKTGKNQPVRQERG